jgi:hypothetical protein
MARQTTRRIQDLAVGDSFLVGHERHAYFGRTYLAFPDSRRVTVSEASRDRVACLEADGTRFDIPMADGKPHWRAAGQVLWTAELPDGTDAQVKAYCDTLLAHTRGTLLLHVTAADAEGFDAELVSLRTGDLIEGHIPGDEDEGPEEAWTGASHGRADFWDRTLRVVPKADCTPAPFGIPSVDLDGIPAVGDLVMARAYACRVEGDRIVTVHDGLVRIGNFPTRQAAAAFLPDHARPSFFLHLPATHQDHLMEQERARVALEPDEALVLWYDQPDGSGRSCAFLSTSGLVFHMVDALPDYFHGADVEPGLYLLRGARWWSDVSHEGEHDAGIEGNFEPATPEDCARHGFPDLEALDREILDHLEDEPGDAADFSALRMMERAREAVAASAPSP